MSMEEKAEKLLKLGVKNIIVTLGKSGAYLKMKNIRCILKEIHLWQLIRQGERMHLSVLWQWP